MNETLKTHIKYDYLLKLVRDGENKYIISLPANKIVNLESKQVFIELGDELVKLQVKDTTFKVELQKSFQVSFIIAYLALEQTLRGMDVSLFGIFDENNEYVESDIYNEFNLDEDEQRDAYIGTVVLAAMDKTNKMTQYLEELLYA